MSAARGGNPVDTPAGFTANCATIGRWTRGCDNARRGRAGSSRGRTSAACCCARRNCDPPFAEVRSSGCAGTPMSSPRSGGRHGRRSGSPCGRVPSCGHVRAMRRATRARWRSTGCPAGGCRPTSWISVGGSGGRGPQPACERTLAGTASTPSMSTVWPVDIGTAVVQVAQRHGMVPALVALDRALHDEVPLAGGAGGRHARCAGPGGASPTRPDHRSG